VALPAGLRLPQDADDLLGRVMCLLHDGFPFVTRKPSHPQWPSSEGPNQWLNSNLTALNAGNTYSAMKAIAAGK